MRGCEALKLCRAAPSSPRIRSALLPAGEKREPAIAAGIPTRELCPFAVSGHEIARRAGEKQLDVLDQLVGQGLDRLAAGPGDMRGEDDVFA